MLTAAGVGVFVLLLAVTALNYWLAFQQLRPRIIGAAGDTVAADFLMVAATNLALRAAAFLAACGALTGLLARTRVIRNPGRLFVLLLLTLAPLLLHAVRVYVALLSGWQLDTWVLSTEGTASKELAATLYEAIPVLLEPVDGTECWPLNAMKLFAPAAR